MRKERAAGFTLIELMIVLMIIGILTAIVIPNLYRTPIRAKEAVLKTNLHTMREAIDQFYADNGNYPASLDDLVDEDYLRAVPLDPITDSRETWKLEYMELDPEEIPAETDIPEEGEGALIDVFSGAEGLSLDGEAYAEW